MLKLGRIPSKPDERDFRFARYVDLDKLPGAPSKRDWTHPVDSPAWGMFSNDRLGNCTCAAQGHYLQAQSANTGRPLTILGADIIQLYRDVSGYDPKRPETDQGAEMRDVLTEMRAVGLCRHRIGAFAAVDPQDRDHVEAAVNSFGGLFAGLDMPAAWRDATNWDIGDRSARWEPNSWGPHAVEIVGYDHIGLTCITWSVPKLITWEAFQRYCSEAWVEIDPQWIDDTTMLSPSGFDLEQLMRDLVEIDRR